MANTANRESKNSLSPFRILQLLLLFDSRSVGGEGNIHEGKAQRGSKEGEKCYIGADQ
jgi:hypothetical protein